MFWLIMRLCTRAPAKFVVLLLSTCTILLSLYQVWLLLRKQGTHAHYLQVVEGNDGSITYQMIDSTGDEKVQLGKTTHVLLCLDAYLTLKRRSTVEFPICIHEPADDKYISKSLFDGFLYEHDHVRTLLDYLSREPNLGLLDIGANLGVYTLPAAHMGKHVVAVEALPQNILRLKTSLELGGIQQRVNVIESAVSNSHSDLFALTWKVKNNIGGSQVVEKQGCLKPDCDIDQPIEAILMDDLLDIIPFKKGVMKIDIEGYEMYAFEQSSKLLDAVDFVVILMEWRMYGHFIYVPSMWEPVKKFIRFFTERDYLPADVLSGNVLALDEWHKWPMQIMWRKSYSFD